MQATEGVSKRYDALMDLFEEIPFFFDSTLARSSSAQNWGTASRRGAVTILVHLLDVFALALKMTSTRLGSWKRLGAYPRPEHRPLMNGHTRPSTLRKESDGYDRHAGRAGTSASAH